jgi:hypothetical protein
MSGVAPRVVLGQEWWDRVRHAAFKATRYHCAACGVPKWEAVEKQWLEGHELYTIDYKVGRMVYNGTVGLCHYCHCFIHEGRLRILLSRGEITADKYAAVMEHGTRVLKAAGLVKPLPHLGDCAMWADWRMVVEGKEYAPLYRTYEEWKKHFSGAEG